MIWSNYGFWDQWLNPHKVVFDGMRRLIIVNPATTNLDIKKDVYSDWKEWLQQDQNAKYLPAIRTIGGDAIGGGLFAGDLYFLQNGWRLIIDVSKVSVSGVLFSDNYETAYFNENLQEIFPARVSSLVTSTGISPQEIRNALTYPATLVPQVGSIDKKIQSVGDTVIALS